MAFQMHLLYVIPDDFRMLYGIYKSNSKQLGLLMFFLRKQQQKKESPGHANIAPLSANWPN